MNFINTANMMLPVPIVGEETGPLYAIDINDCFTLLDQHDHTPGKGVPITPEGLNINADLSFNNNSAVDLKALTLVSQSITAYNGSLYRKSADLYYVDGLGNDIRITQSGAIAGTPGSIANLVAPASASYVAISSKFVWQSNTSIAADMDFGAAIMRNITPNSTFALTLRPPAALSSNFTLTLPVVPASTKILRVDSSGNMSSTLDVDNSTIQISSNNLQVVPGGIGPTQIAAGGVEWANLSSEINFHNATFTANDTFEIPDNTNVVYIEGVGAGGGGGGGGSTSNSGGGGGGGGALFSTIALPVTPGDILTITVGAAGTAGAAATSGGDGGATIVSSSAGVVATWQGGAGAGRGGSGAAAGVVGNNTVFVTGGTAGTGGGSAGGGGGGGAGNVIGRLAAGAGGNTGGSNGGSTAVSSGGGGGGGATGAAGNGGTGGISLYQTTGASGGSGSGVGGGGGGGGGSSIGLGGTGGNGSNSPTAGTAGGIGAGGGGGGGSSDSGAGAAGGAGGGGRVRISWLGSSS